ncbi:MAG: hypothetical protein Fur0024_3420 [Patescibacteria group bacterium]
MQVENPKSVYSPQKDIMLVKIKRAPRTSRIVPKIPETIFSANIIKNKIPNEILITLSLFPTFLFINFLINN